MDNYVASQLLVFTNKTGEDSTCSLMACVWMSLWHVTRKEAARVQGTHLLKWLWQMFFPRMTEIVYLTVEIYFSKKCFG